MRYYILMLKCFIDNAFNLRPCHSPPLISDCQQLLHKNTIGDGDPPNIFFLCPLTKEQSGLGTRLMQSYLMGDLKSSTIIIIVGIV